MKTFKNLLVLILIFGLLTACMPTAANENPKPMTNTNAPVVDPTDTANPTKNASPSNDVSATQVPTVTPTAVVVPSSTNTPTTSTEQEQEQSDRFFVEYIPSETTQSLPINSENGVINYATDEGLYIQSADLSTEPFLLEETYFSTQWSPNGRFLMYMQFGRNETTNQNETLLTIADLEGNKQVLHIVGYISSRPTWSPDSQQIALRLPTSISPYGSVEEIWTVTLDAEDQLQPPTHVGNIDLPLGSCSNVGGAWVNILYDRQTGFALQTPNDLHWAAHHILFYSMGDCDSYAGYGRFNMKTGEALDPIPETIIGFVLNPEKDRWVAITGSNGHAEDGPTSKQIVTGNVTDTEVQIIETSVSVDLVSIGLQDGRFYYTSRELIDKTSLSDQMGDFDYGSLFFTYQTQLWSIDPNGEDEQLHWENEDHSYSRIAQTKDGELLFTVVENDSALHNAVINGLPEETWQDYMPQIHIMRQSAAMETPTLWLENAGILSIWVP